MLDRCAPPPSPDIFATCLNGFITGTLLLRWRSSEISVLDPWPFYTDPDRTSGLGIRIRILLFSSLAFKMASKNEFCSQVFYSYYLKIIVIQKSENCREIKVFLSFVAWLWKVIWIRPTIMEFGSVILLEIIRKFVVVLSHQLGAWYHITVFPLFC